MASGKRRWLRVRALRIEQDPDNPLYMFSLSGSDLLDVAEISRVSRDESGKLIGYQRPEVKKHVKEIVDYLEGKHVVFPNPIVLSLCSTVNFKKSRGPKIGVDSVVAGTLEIPVSSDPDKKPAWIVDGQQRALAISKCKRSSLPFPITAFVSDDVDLQRDQFVRVNNTRPLPRGLISELLPEISTSLPPKLAVRKIPAALCDLLNRNPDSPFCGIIRRPSTPAKEKKLCVVTDTSVINMIENSLSSPTGSLFPYRNLATGETDFDSIIKLLNVYWTGVKQTFPKAWGLPTKKSRLMHGVGIVSMGRVMDRVMAAVPHDAPNAVKKVAKELSGLRPICAWTSGVWDELGGIPWDMPQNTPKDKRLLSNLLLRTYVESRGSRR